MDAGIKRRPQGRGGKESGCRTRGVRRWKRMTLAREGQRMLTAVGESERADSDAAKIKGAARVVRLERDCAAVRVELAAFASSGPRRIFGLGIIDDRFAIDADPDAFSLHGDQCREPFRFV